MRFAGRLCFIFALSFFLAASAMAEGRRVALVIGNSNYANVATLPNPVKDADSIAEALSRLGFEVTHLDDLGISSMRKALAAFEDNAKGADWALVYYAGHGMEMEGKNWLVPVDAVLAKSSDVADEAIPLERVLERVRPANSLRIIILDACRNNPFLSRMVMGRGGTRSVARGLAPIEPQRGEVVFYAARDGHVAQDGNGTHSPFAQALLKAIEKPGLELGFFFREITSEVLEATAPESQEPFVYGSLPRQQYYFKSAEVIAVQSGDAHQQAILDEKSNALAEQQKRPANSVAPNNQSATKTSPASSHQVTSAMSDIRRTVNLDLKDGRVVIELRPDIAPKHVERVKKLISEGFYDGLKFHRVITGFMAQTGDPKGDGTGGSKYPDVPAEFSSESFKRGTIGAARTSNPNSANSQFFICLEDAPHLNGQYTVWGRVVEGMQFVDKIKKGQDGSGAVSNPDVIVKMQLASGAH